MFKLTKESRNTFLGLLIVPFVWIGLNSYGILDGWETWTLDKRMTWNPFGLFRGEISHRTAVNANQKVIVENNQTVPRIPKVMYVNFDNKTMGMDEVGERPWDRAFFRDTAIALLEMGKARVVAFDFGFTPKSASKMVPGENVYRSDSAIDVGRFSVNRKTTVQLIIGLGVIFVLAQSTFTVSETEQVILTQFGQSAKA